MSDPLGADPVGAGTVLVGPDVSKPATVDQTLTEQHRLAVVGSLTAKIVHALNDPLTLLKANLGGLAEQLAGGAPDDSAEGRTELLAEVAEGVAALEGLVGALREFVQGDQPPALFDLVETAELAIAVADVKVRYGAHIELRADGPVPLVGRRRQVQQLLVALLLHADSRPTSLGSIIVAARPGAAGGAQLSVIDERPPGVERNVPEGSSDDEFDPEISLLIASFIAADHGGSLELVERSGQGPRYDVSLPAGGAREPTEDDARG